jgi:acyl carrier protein
LTAQATHPVFAAAMLEAPGQQIADRLKIAFLYLAKTRFDGEHRIYQWAQKIAERRYCFTFSLYHALSQFNEKAKQSMSVRLRIISAIQQIAVEQQITLPPLDDDLSLHETGFDSLGFAILVARLEDDLGIDPFTISEDASFPLTIGDFIRAYENVPA